MSLVPDFSTRRSRPRVRPLDSALLALAGVAVATSAYVAATSWAQARSVEESVIRARGELADAKSKTATLEARTGRGPMALLASRALLTSVAPPPRVLE